MEAQSTIQEGMNYFRDVKSAVKRKAYPEMYRETPKSQKNTPFETNFTLLLAESVFS